MIDITAVIANYTGSGPYGYTGKNASGAGATDGTEWIAAVIDNWLWGPQQALFEHEGFTANGVTEAAGGASQVLDAWQNILPPGCIIEWNINTDPATYGARYLLLNGQGILVANYSDLVTNVYVGDGNNAAVAAAGGAYYRADDAAGTTPNTAGAYLILPESRGYTTRGLDTAASVDPFGASRYLGDNQGSAMWGHWHRMFQQAGGGTLDYPGLLGTTNGLQQDTGLQINGPGAAISDGVNGTPSLSSESRMTNRSTKFAIRY